MGANQDIGGYSLGVGNEAGFGIYRLSDNYSAPGDVSFYYDAGAGSVVEGSRLEVWLDDTLDATYDLIDYLNPITGKYYLEYLKTLAAAHRLTIQIYNVKASSLVFREFILSQATGKVLVNERFDGQFGEWWDINEFGNDFSTVPGALYYSLYSDGGAIYSYELTKEFTTVDITENRVFLNTDQDSQLEVRATTGEWIPVLNFPTDRAADPYGYLYDPPEGFNGMINAFRKRFLFEPF